eukprot:CAMPEP_0119018432 /NCGR_PEP_ID=MMETSP1176-20130426/19400_1 /TAXON_ID=265551 /ORGANISM="Synedropsis recta cf, Strain CCMP1620" /LENGTH=207 /DNA_ID=CAMNT_0006972435 /DNA_START=12 /DNA_END=632 /DNA_ORIENTATION=-
MSTHQTAAVLKLRREKKELDNMLARRSTSSALSPSSNHHQTAASIESITRSTSSAEPRSILRKSHAFPISVSTNSLNGKRRATAASFQASMNFQDTSHKRLKVMPKKPEEGQITWSNVYEAKPVEVPKVKVDDSRGPLLVLAGDTNKGDSSNSDTSCNNSWSDFKEAMTTATNSCSNMVTEPVAGEGVKGTTTQTAGEGSTEEERKS